LFLLLLNFCSIKFYAFVDGGKFTILFCSSLIPHKFTPLVLSLLHLFFKFSHTKLIFDTGSFQFA